MPKGSMTIQGIKGNINHNNISGSIISNNISGVITELQKAGTIAQRNLSGTITQGSGEILPAYTGEYIINSKVETQTLNTQNKSLYDNITVLPNITEQLPNGNGSVFIIH